MWQLKKKGVSRTYRLFNGDQEISNVVSDSAWHNGSTQIDGHEIAFALYNDGTEVFIASVDGQRVATATRPDPGLRRFDIQQADVVLRMDISGFGQKPFEVTNSSGDQIGVVALRGAMGRRIEIDLPQSLPLAVRVFAGWLATRSYNKVAETRVIPQ